MSAQDIVDALRKVGEKRSKAKVTEAITDVLAWDDSVLLDFIGRVELVDGFHVPAARDAGALRE